MIRRRAWRTGSAGRSRRTTTPRASRASATTTRSSRTTLRRTSSSTRTRTPSATKTSPRRSCKRTRTSSTTTTTSRFFCRRPSRPRPSRPRPSRPLPTTTHTRRPRTRSTLRPTSRPTTTPATTGPTRPRSSGRSFPGPCASSRSRSTKKTSTHPLCFPPASSDTIDDPNATKKSLPPLPIACLNSLPHSRRALFSTRGVPPPAPRAGLHPPLSPLHGASMLARHLRRVPSHRPSSTLLLIRAGASMISPFLRREAPARAFTHLLFRPHVDASPPPTTRPLRRAGLDQPLIPPHRPRGASRPAGPPPNPAPPLLDATPPSGSAQAHTHLTARDMVPPSVVHSPEAPSTTPPRASAAPRGRAQATAPPSSHPVSPDVLRRPRGWDGVR
mmetsp:Transcript_19481/g.61247  ORF Transcript_19481/g.61247 Transcript_19481/m.61247 type:complete len:387 (-) Transcript_19481:131-1291(-)